MRRLAIVLMLAMPCTADEVQVFPLDRSGSTNEALPNQSSPSLRYGICAGSEEQTFLFFDIDDLPSDATIVSATLRLRASTGGDGELWRCRDNWDSTPTWYEIGDAATIGLPAGIGVSSNTSVSVNVTALVQAWHGGTTNRGWVCKGVVDDCSAVRLQISGCLLTVVYRLPAPPPDADFDGDGYVDGEDFLIWQANYGTGTTHAQGDADWDGDVDGEDFLIWQEQSGQ